MLIRGAISSAGLGTAAPVPGHCGAGPVLPDRDPVKRSEITGVQYLRALAALFVVVFHTSVHDADFAWPRDLPRGFGAGGVDIFFVISGFIMMLVTATRPTSPGQFLIRRLARIGPLYWAVTLAVAVLGLVAPAAIVNDAVTVRHLVLSLLFLPHADPASGAITTLYKVGWTLDYEVYFYVLFALCLTLHSPARRLGVLVGFAAAAAAVFSIVRPGSAALQVYTNPILFEFVLGAAIGHLHVNGRLARLGRGAAFWSCSLGLAALLTLPVDDATRIALHGIPSAALLSGLLAFEAAGRVPRIGWLVLLGDASYAIYLVHPVVETLFRVAARGGHVPVGLGAVGIVATVLAVVTSTVAGVAVHRAVEVPLLRAVMARLRFTPRSVPRRTAERDSHLPLAYLQRRW